MWQGNYLIVLAGILLASTAAMAQAGGAAGVGSFRPTRAGEARIVLEQTALERGQPVKGKVVLPAAEGAPGARRPNLIIRVSDSLGRLLVEEAMPLGPQANEVPFEVEVPGVVAMRHTISAATDEPRGAGMDFIYCPPKEWDDYICTIWQRHNEKRIPYLQEMCLSGSQWSGSSSHLPQHFIEANYRYYLETGATWIFAPYHMWMPDKEKTYYHKQAKAAFTKDRTDFRILERNPCLSNDHVRSRIEWTFTHQARLHRDTRPLYYTVADEPGIANQAAPFDYCFSPHCMQAFREWCRKRYGTLAALNEQWGSQHRRWEDVRGATTDEIFARKEDNFSPWCDHKEFMDDVLVGGYALAKQYMLRHDPAGRIGMGGAQGPAAVGGWDFWKLCQVFDVLEAYYIGNNYELMRSFNPDLIGFHASFGPGDPEKHLIWYLFIHGDRGLLVWDDKSEYVTDEGKYSPRARQARPWYQELTGGIGRLRIASKRTDDPIALYHSQANLRVHWVLEVRPSGKDWIRRDSGSERINSRYFRLRESWVKLIEDNGLQYRFLCPPQVGKGELKAYDAKTGQGFKVLILPEVLALSDGEAKAIQAFVKAGGTVIADKLPGSFDEHGKKRDASPLAKLFEDQKRAILLDQEMLPYYQQRILPGSKDLALRDTLGGLLTQALGKDRVTPEVVGADGKPVTGVEVTVWRNGRAELLALHRNPLLRVNELGPQEYKKNLKFEVPVKLSVRRRDATTAWFDVRSGSSLGGGKELGVTLPPFEPVFLAALPGLGKVTPLKATVAEGKITVVPDGYGQGLEQCVFHFDFIGPDGKERLVYRSNVACGPKGGQWPLPLALNDAAGKWTLKLRQVATGSALDVPFQHGRPD
ncbi:MAG: hypothetical protein AMJ81_03185 [Phycisphaerae bacterium SM23_33]|nr:MAG: hypothetical protein AMJ81_03185 [Phycisphaerae bacterium SM23_33]